MNLLFFFIGGAVGGVIGWLIDRKRNGGEIPAKARPAEQACETST